MSVFEPDPEAVPELHAVREVRLGMAAHRRAETLDFYADLCGLPFWPKKQQLPGCIGLGNPRKGLLLECQHDPIVDDVRRRLTLTVPNLDVLAKRLDEQDWEYERIRGIGVSDNRIYVHDPTGHRIEVRQFRAL